MKIALVIERMDDFRGGRETSTGQIATILAERGHEVDILCESGSWRSEGVDVVEVPDGPLCVEITAYHKAEERQWIVHLVNFQS